MKRYLPAAWYGTVLAELGDDHLVARVPDLSIVPAKTGSYRVVETDGDVRWKVEVEVDDNAV